MTAALYCSPTVTISEVSLVFELLKPITITITYLNCFTLQ